MQTLPSLPNGTLGLPNKADQRKCAESRFKEINVAVEEGMKEKAEQFKQQGAEIYKPV